MWGRAQAAGATTRGTLITVEPTAETTGCDWPFAKYVFDHLEKKVTMGKCFNMDQDKSRKGLFGGGGG